MPSADGGVVQDDSLNTGLDCATAFDEQPPALRVHWIRWNSSFHGAGLRPGDRIVAVNGQRVVPPPQPSEPLATIPRFVGNYREPEAWKAAGARDGDPVTLSVRRRNTGGEGWTELELRGAVRLERSYSNASNHRLFGPGGPDQMERDGFDRVWTSWYEDAVRAWSQLLDGDWDRHGFSNALPADANQEHEARLRLLGERYPGPFTDAVRAAYEAVRASLAGRPYQLPPDALDFRQLRERRAGEVSAAGEKARADFLQAHAGDVIPPFPAIDPILGDRRAVTGKLVELPGVTERDWISQGARTAFVISDGQRCYAADAEGPGAQNILEAERRYEALIAPAPRREFRFIARVTGEPTLIVQGDSGVFGLKVEPVAASLGDSFFIDVSPGRDEAPRFAGERELAAYHAAPPPDDAPPRTVMETWFQALKLGDEPLWRSLFCRWEVGFTDGGRPLIAKGEPSRLDGDWIDARRQILENVCDVRVVWVDDVRALVTGQEFPGAPRIDQTTVEVDHIHQLADGSYRSFATLYVNRIWVLQRWNGGPWRIATFWGI